MHQYHTHRPTSSSVKRMAIKKGTSCHQTIGGVACLLLPYIAFLLPLASTTNGMHGMQHNAGRRRHQELRPFGHLWKHRA